MARRSSQAPKLDVHLQQMGALLGTNLLNAFVKGLLAGADVSRLTEVLVPLGGTKRVKAGPRTRSKASLAERGGCDVPGCRRSAKSDGICAPHRQKAYRLKLSSPFSAEALARLGQDGRSLWRASKG